MAEEFGPYLLEEVIGRGGMGVVYRAYDTRRDRTVALKRLPRELASDEHFQARFRRESRLAARLNEPHIIPIHDFGEHDGQLFIDMRLVEGVDLSKLITDEGGALSVELAVDIIVQVSAALASAHTAGLMHRDIKPSNVLISGKTREDRTSPFAYLVDFGIARAIGNEGTALTSTTDWFGTVAYMAPERISGSSGDARSDIYSLACLLYQCLTGQAPFTGEALQVLFAHVNNAPPSTSEKARAIPAGLDAAIRRGMAKKPEDRYQTVSQFAAAVKSSARAETTGALPAVTGLPPQPPAGSYGPQQSRPPQAGPPQSYPPQGGGTGSYAGPAQSLPPQAGPQQSIPPRSGPPQSYPPRHAPAAGPPQSFPPRSGPPQSVPPQAGPQQSIPPRSGPANAGAPTAQGSTAGSYAGSAYSGAPRTGSPQSGPPNSLPPRSGPSNSIPPGSGPPHSIPPRSGPPHSIPPRSGPPANKNRALSIMIAVAVIVVLAAIIAVVVAVSGDDSSNAGGGSSTGVVTGVTSPPPTTSPPVTTTKPVAAWSTPYQQFTQLIGDSPGASSTAYRGATCTLSGPDATIPGMVDQVTCTGLSGGSKVVFYLGRFTGKTAIDTYLDSLVKLKYNKTYWTTSSIRRGLLLTSPSTIKYADVTSSICGIPEFLVQFYAAEGSGVTETQLENDYWKPSVFPDSTPAVCS